MCGIVGYVGDRPAKPFIIQGLKRLEYRGYDSWGYAVFDGEKAEDIGRSLGRAGDDTRQRPADEEHWGSLSKGTVGIGHTRWATHGGVTLDNTHPVCGHKDWDITFYVVHNGVVTNHQELREKLEGEGYRFSGQTDTEVVAHFLDWLYRLGSGNARLRNTAESYRELVSAAVAVLRGSFALAVVPAKRPDHAVLVSRGAPLLVTREGHFASDPVAFVGHAETYRRLPEPAVIAVTRDGPKWFWPPEPGSPVPKEASVSRGDHPDFMHKEIHEQPAMLEEPYFGRLADWPMDTACLFGCGSSYFAAKIGKHYLEEVAGWDCWAAYATELEAGPVPLARNFIALTQSGETRDTLAAMQRVRRHCGLPGRAPDYYAVAAVTNVPTSLAADLATCVLPVGAGPEIGVAATKTFTGQVAVLLRLAYEARDRRGEADLLLTEAAQAVRSALAHEGQVRGLAEWLNGFRHALVLGRGILYPVAREGSLKLKEVAQLHAEALHSSEMKHGPLALVDKDTASVFFVPYESDALLDRVLGNVSEVLARGGPALLVADTKSIGRVERCVPNVRRFVLKHVPPHAQPFPYAVFMQLLAYHTAKLRGLDVDRPRSLAKSITVE
jgi:glucosamine--fructose-6-phosphate aminotransferase (isomerizing)